MMMLAVIALIASHGWGADSPPKSPREIDPARWAAAADRLIREGKNALAAGDFVTARDQFASVLDVDDRNVPALHGIALGHFGLGEKTRGASAIEKAIEILEKQGKKPDRALLLNASMAQIADRKPMRAAKYLMDYMKEHPDPIDEAVLNALGAAREAADRQAQRMTFYAQVDKFYREQNARLEKTRRDGWRRWGVRWVNPAEYSRLDRQHNLLLDQGNRVASAARELALARTRLKDLQTRAMIGTASRAQITTARNNLTARETAYNNAVTAYLQRRATTTLPEYPEKLAAVPMDELAPSQQVVTVVTADQTAALRQARRTARQDTTVAPKPPVQKQDEEALDQVKPREVVVPKQPGKRTLTRMAATFPIAPGLLVTSADAVNGAREITLSDLAGNTYPATVVRADTEIGLALLKADGAAGKLTPARLANSFKSGPVQCVSFAPVSIFDLKSELITGSLRITRETASLSLPREPRRTGAPLIAGGEIVGVALNDRGANPADLPVATLEQLRKFLANDADLPAGAAAGHPADVLCELQATVEVQ